MERTKIFSLPYRPASNGGTNRLHSRTLKENGDMNDVSSNKKVLVTGASSGIGRATAEVFLEAGATVALVGRRKAALAEVASQARFGEAHVISADLSDPNESEQV